MSTANCLKLFQLLGCQSTRNFVRQETDAKNIAKLAFLMVSILLLFFVPARFLKHWSFRGNSFFRHSMIDFRGVHLKFLLRDHTVCCDSHFYTQDVESFVLLNGWLPVAISYSISPQWVHLVWPDYTVLAILPAIPELVTAVAVCDTFAVIVQWPSCFAAPWWAPWLCVIAVCTLQPDWVAECVLRNSSLWPLECWPRLSVCWRLIGRWVTEYPDLNIYSCWLHQFYWRQQSN